MRRKKCTISDIANALNISRASVSRALSGNIGVGDDLKQEILDYANKAGYHFNTSSKSTNKIIGLSLGDLRNPFYFSLAYFIQQELNESGYALVIYNNAYDTKKELNFIRQAEQFHMAGIILVTVQSNEISEILSKISIPKVLVNRVLPDYTGDSVLMDNFQAGYDATLHLIKLGHKHIGFICGNKLSSASSQRFEGYLQAIQNFSIPYNENFIWHSDLTMEAGYKVAESYISSQDRPSAIVSINDMTTLGFMDGCQKQGIKIPEDLSVVSFDNIQISSIQSVQLTSVSQHSEEMGKTAANLLLKQINHPKSKPERIILKPTLIIRNTTREYNDVGVKSIVKTNIDN